MFVELGVSSLLTMATFICDNDDPPSQHRIKLQLPINPTKSSSLELIRDFELRFGRSKGKRHATHLSGSIRPQPQTGMDKKNLSKWVKWKRLWKFICCCFLDLGCVLISRLGARPSLHASLTLIPTCNIKMFSFQATALK